MRRAARRRRVAGLQQVEIAGPGDRAGNEGEDFAAVLVEAERAWRAVEPGRAQVGEQRVHGRRPRARRAAHGVAHPDDAAADVPAGQRYLGHGGRPSSRNAVACSSASRFELARKAPQLTWRRPAECLSPDMPQLPWHKTPAGEERPGSGKLPVTTPFICQAGAPFAMHCDVRPLVVSGCVEGGR